MRPEPRTVEQLLIEASDILVVRISPADVEAEAARVETITHERVIRRGYSVKLRAGDGIEGTDTTDTKQIDRLNRSSRVSVSEDTRPCLRSQHSAIACCLEILAEAIVGEEHKALVAPVIFRQQNRAADVESEEVLSQHLLGRIRRVIEEGVGVQRVVAMLIEKPAMKFVAAGFGDHASLGHAASGVRADSSDRHAEFTYGIERRRADGKERTGLDEVVHGIDAVLGDVGGAATESAHRSVTGIGSHHGNSGLKARKIKRIAA